MNNSSALDLLCTYSSVNPAAVIEERRWFLEKSLEANQAVS
ncbi:hypothetical protein [Microseira sp. BLCC-F43]